MTNHSVISNDAITDLFDIADYDLLEKIGEGGFGRVYRARKINTAQIVAIKFLTLNAEFDLAKSNRYVERFERETLLCSRLNHPNIVHLLDKGQTRQGDFYAVFEYVEGLTLKDTLALDGPLTAIQTSDIMSQVLDALAHAHSQGVIHRDIKPDNIMLTKTGTKIHAKVLDFGIGALDEQTRQLDYKSLTLTRETLGTPSYSAPEQLRGEPPTPKTDLYVWALVFLECLTGRPAVFGSTLASIFHKQLSQSSVPLPPALAGHPVAALLSRVLVKKAHERMVTAEDIYTELKKINFSNLVGEITTTRQSHADTDHCLEYDRTQVDMGSAGFTGVTERKQITALCLSINVESVNNQLVDFEVMDALHRDIINQCMDIAIRYGAFHVGTLGDTLLFYFGYPVATDHDTRLSARTALDIISNLKQHNSLLQHTQGIIAKAQLGMHTGLITCYADAAPEGDTASIAMILARKAAPNEILCSDALKNRLDTYVEFEPASSLIIGADRQNRSLFRLTAERQVEAFGFLRNAQSDERFFGRDEQLTQLLSLLSNQSQTSRDLTPKHAHIFGEAGIGKSRLLFEFRKKTTDYIHYVSQCLPEHKNNALYPILNVLKYKFSLDELTLQAAADKLTHVINQLGYFKNNEEKNQAKVILFSWLTLPIADDVANIDLAPSEQQKVLFEILFNLLTLQETPERLAALYIFEDLHWADQTTMAFIGQFVNCAVFNASDSICVSTSRQTIADLTADVDFIAIALTKLEYIHSQRFIQALFDQQAISEQLLEMLVARSDGIPLFIEELVNMLKQKQLIHQVNGVIDFIDADKKSQLPHSLRDSLQQKLDGIVYAKETAQFAAAIGREFDYDFLVAGSNQSESQLQNNLSELIAADLIYLQRKVSGDSYIFKHALVRDVAYDSITPTNKISTHLKLAQTLETQFIAMSNRFPNIPAGHWALANRPDKASKWYLEAGDQASQLFVIDQSIAYYRQSISQLELQTDNNSLKQRKFEQSYIGLADNLIKKGQHPEARACYKKALSEQADSAVKDTLLHLKIGKSWETHHNHQQALGEYNHADNLLNNIDEQHKCDDWWDGWLKIQSAKLYVNYWQGNVAAMAELIAKIEPVVSQKANPEQQARFYDDVLHLRFRQRRFALVKDDVELAQNARTAALNTSDLALQAYSTFVLGFSLYFYGDRPQAQQELLNALALAEQQNDITLKARCLTYITMNYRRLGNNDQALKYARESFVISTTAGMDDYVAVANANLAWVEYKQHNALESLRLIGLSNSIWNALADEFPFPLQWLSLLTELDLLHTANNNGGYKEHMPRLKQIVAILLDQKQQKLPEVLTDHLNSFYQDDNMDTLRINKCLTDALINAKQLGYL